jgi:hypothetical protein
MVDKKGVEYGRGPMVQCFSMQDPFIYFYGLTAERV